MITAAGVFRLVLACHALPGVCGSTRPWVALGKRLLRASLAHASARPPLGLLSDQVLNEHGHGCWCNGGGLIFRPTYGLEAIGPERKARKARRRSRRHASADSPSPCDCGCVAA